MCGLIAVASPAAEHSKVPQSCPTLLRPPWTIAYQAPSSMGFSSQEYWSGVPFPSPEDLPNPGMEPIFPALQTDALPSEQALEHIGSVVVVPGL